MGQDIDGRIIFCSDCYRAEKTGSCNWKTALDMDRVSGCSDGVDAIMALECLEAHADKYQEAIDVTLERLQDQPIVQDIIKQAVLAAIEMQEARILALKAQAKVIKLEATSTR